MSAREKANGLDNAEWPHLLRFMDNADIILKFKAADVEPDTVAHEINEMLTNLDILGPRQRAELEIAMAEALINAVDYGCLELKQSEKAPDLTSPSIYHQKRRERLAQPEWAQREVTIRIVIDNDKLSFKIIDPGPGIPKVIKKHKDIVPYGRGIQLMRELLDKVIIQRNPSAITLIKYRG